MEVQKPSLHNIKKIKLQDYQIGRNLGRGGFGKVKLIKLKKSIADEIKGQSTYYALKMLKKHDIIKARQMDHVYGQNLIHSQISHPFIVGFEGFAQDSRYIYLVLELINGGQLFSYLRKVEVFNTEQSKFYAATITLIFQYLHGKNIIYRDLKPENLLIGADGYLKLGDFGFAKIINEGRTFTICGTPQYLAPQIILSQGHGKAVDWWTLGVLIYQMHVGVDPFSDDDAMGIYKNILRGKLSFPTQFQRQCKEARSLIKHLLVADLSKRYGNLKEGVNDIKKHRWFKNFNWKDLIDKKLTPLYIPSVKYKGDISNFLFCPDSNILVPEIKETCDPFLNW